MFMSQIYTNLAGFTDTRQQAIIVYLEQLK